MHPLCSVRHLVNYSGLNLTYFCNQKLMSQLGLWLQGSWQIPFCPCHFCLWCPPLPLVWSAVGRGRTRLLPEFETSGLFHSSLYLLVHFSSFLCQIDFFLSLVEILQCYYTVCSALDLLHQPVPLWSREWILNFVSVRFLDFVFWVFHLLSPSLSVFLFSNADKRLVTTYLNTTISPLVTIILYSVKLPTYQTLLLLVNRVSPPNLHVILSSLPHPSSSLYYCYNFTFSSCTLLSCH